MLWTDVTSATLADHVGNSNCGQYRSEVIGAGACFRSVARGACLLASPIPRRERTDCAAGFTAFFMLIDAPSRVFDAAEWPGLKRTRCRLLEKA
jgi:hypothetical protein